MIHYIRISEETQGIRRSVQRKVTYINIPPVLFVSAFSIQEAALPCKDAGPQKKQGRLTSQQAAPHGINTPLFYGGKPGKDTAFAACHIRS